MTGQPDLLAERFAALTNMLDDSDWKEVRRHARPVPRRALAIPVAAALAVVIGGSAFAVYREMVDFFSAAPAPERIQRDFDFLREHTAEASAKFGGPRFTTEGPAREAMRVQIDGEVRSYWVVPTREGGFCTRLHFLVSCMTPEQRQVKIGAGIGAGGLTAGDSGGFDWIKGSVSDEAVQEVELLYQDGERVQLPFVWVSAPIDAGFFAYDVPEPHEQPGRLAGAVIGRDADGNVVAHFCLRLSPDEVVGSDPTVVAMCKRPR
jgi:hypothetical protein